MKSHFPTFPLSHLLASLALLVLLACQVLAQPFSNIVISSTCALTSLSSNGVLYIFPAPPAARTNAIVIDFDVNPSPYTFNPLAIQTYGGYAYSPLHTPIRRYQWNMGDGTTFDSTVFPDGEFIDYVYAAPGIYAVTYTVTDVIGDKKSLTKLITIPLPLILEARATNGYMVLTSSHLNGPWIVAPTNGQQFFKLAPK